MRQSLRTVLSRWLAAPSPAPEEPYDFAGSLSDAERRIVEAALPHSLTSAERVVAAHDAVRYIVQREIPGVIVECGVWRGGSVLAMILTLQQLGVDDREIYLYDTFEGMTEPSDNDRSRFGERALVTWQQAKAAGQQAWDYWFKPEMFNLEQVKELLGATGYPSERLHYIVGPVEETLPEHAPEAIALLRLDTDWYDSTKHELVHLYPLVAERGALIIDDYGHWEGCRRAVDEYFAEAPPLLLGRIDYTGRMAIKH